MIEYCAVPRTIDPEKIPQEYIRAITTFTKSRAGSVLIALPDEESPRTEPESAEYSRLLFPETVSSMQFATIEALDELFARESDPDPKLYELLEMNPRQLRHDVFTFWKRNALLLSDYPAGGSAAPYLLRQSTQSIEQMFPFTISPSYTPVKSIAHPRWSPHFALVLNYRKDLQGLNGKAPETYAATKSWMNAAVGYDYVQGFRIGQTPEISDKAKQNWKLQD